MTLVLVRPGEAPVWTYWRSPLLNEIVDPAYVKLGPERVNAIMSRTALRLSEYTGQEILWHNLKDCSSWMHGDFGNSWFKSRRLRPDPR